MTNPFVTNKYNNYGIYTPSLYGVDYSTSETDNNDDSSIFGYNAASSLGCCDTFTSSTGVSNDFCSNFCNQKIPNVYDVIAQSRAARLGNTGSNFSSGGLTGTSNSAVVNAAKQYLGCNEGNGSYLKFTNGRSEAWCADFVTYAVKEAFAKTGKSLPSDFGSASVSGLKSWGENHGCYVDKSNYSSVKAGDIVIFGNGSHTGIVESIGSDGTVNTIEGNTSDPSHKVGSDCVAEKNRNINSSNITGFVLLSKLG